MAEVVISSPGARRTWRRPPLISNPRLRWFLWISVAIYLTAAFGTLDLNWTRIAQGWERGQRFLNGFFPPDFTSRQDAIIDGVLESLWMAFAATVVGIILSIPIGVGGARNLVPPPVYMVCRSIMAASRTLPEILVAIFFVKLFGFGTFAGFMTLTFATIGYFGKLLAEDIESASQSPLEAMRAVGASWLQRLNYAVQPLVMPRAIGIAIYRLDMNFRESAVIGIVGAGGIGATLNTAFDRYEYPSAAAILLVIILIVLGSEYTSAFCRKLVR
ncbi:MAG: phosphonate ABC transporter, permease protein PhnE [Rhodospirillaceae bacterium]|nr:phosphonate ABC transporter, permease protein PhnE [Rhodospirillaceae bacterium]